MTTVVFRRGMMRRVTDGLKSRHPFAGSLQWALAVSQEAQQYSRVLVAGEESLLVGCTVVILSSSKP